MNFTLLPSIHNFNYHSLYQTILSKYSFADELIISHTQFQLLFLTQKIPSKILLLINFTLSLLTSKNLIQNRMLSIHNFNFHTSH